MSVEDQISEYIAEISEAGDRVPPCLEDGFPMQIAKMQDVWRRL